MAKSAARRGKLWTTPAVQALRAAKDVDVAELDAAGTPGFRGDKVAGAALLAEREPRLSALQEKLYANGRSGDHRAVLLVLQGMDTAGKGGIVRHVIGAVDPQGVDHASFGVPTEEEKQHHYLWRIRNALPRAGRIGVFDRSHYEDVLVVRVHNLVPPDVWEPRYDEINAFEKEVVDAGTAIVKVALVISKDEQHDRLRERLERPDKYWKYNPGDVDERGFWPDYQQAYQAMLDRTNTAHAPWFLLPADRKWFARLAVTELLIHTLESMDLDWPPPNFDVETELRRLG
ncbi:MAG: polyphosphate kinase 2 family protein [Mycobacteriaceae bacterium]|nr:polyphosphate kinase 2 family protein [Mycobacteriaceae bacterium]